MIYIDLFIKQHKSIDDIISIMGIDKLKYHPHNRYDFTMDKFIYETIKYNNKQSVIWCDEE